MIPVTNSLAKLPSFRPYDAAARALDALLAIGDVELLLLSLCWY
jgi:hypothetical protein